MSSASSSSSTVSSANKPSAKKRGFVQTIHVDSTTLKEPTQELIEGEHFMYRYKVRHTMQSHWDRDQFQKDNRFHFDTIPSAVEFWVQLVVNRIEKAKPTKLNPNRLPAGMRVEQFSFYNQITGKVDLDKCYYYEDLASLVNYFNNVHSAPEEQYILIRFKSYKNWKFCPKYDPRNEERDDAEEEETLIIDDYAEIEEAEENCTTKKMCTQKNKEKAKEEEEDEDV